MALYEVLVGKTPDLSGNLLRGCEKLEARLQVSGAGGQGSGGQNPELIVQRSSGGVAEGSTRLKAEDGMQESRTRRKTVGQ